MIINIFNWNEIIGERLDLWVKFFSSIRKSLINLGQHLARPEEP